MFDPTPSRFCDANLHSQSLLRIPLVRQMVEDPGVRLVSRAVDETWRYRRLRPRTVTGFNPFAGEIYYAQRSVFATWWADPAGPTRPLNRRDYLVGEVMFAAHDYLHHWCTALTQRLRPELGFGHAPLSAANVEDMAFAMLLQEACAVVGLDYWYLSTVDLGDVVDIGTRFSGLAVSYRESDRDEFARFDPSFAVQTPAFFAKLVRFYCTGRWEGLDGDALRDSPKLHHWLEHELEYGEQQRVITRGWLRFLSDDDVMVAPRLSAPVACDEPWQQRLIHEVAEALWDKIKRDRVLPQPRRVDPADTWRSDPRKPPDYRFVNRNAVGQVHAERDFERAATRTSGRYLVRQQLARYPLAAIDRGRLPALRHCEQQCDPAAIAGLLHDVEPLPVDAPEVRDLLFIN